MWEKHRSTDSRVLACNPGMCPDREWNRRPFGLRDGAQPTEPHESGLDTFQITFVNWKINPCLIVKKIHLPLPSNAFSPPYSSSLRVPVVCVFQGIFLKNQVNYFAHQILQRFKHFQGWDVQTEKKSQPFFWGIRRRICLHLHTPPPTFLKKKNS